MPDVKAIIELDQKGEPVRVFLAGQQDSAPLIDVTQAVTNKPAKIPGPAPDLGPSHTPRSTMVFYEGNCIWINGRLYCS